MKGCSSATVTGARPTSPSAWLVAAVRSGAVSTMVPSRSKTMVVSLRSRGMGSSSLRNGRKLFVFDVRRKGSGPGRATMEGLIPSPASFHGLACESRRA